MIYLHVSQPLYWIDVYVDESGYVMTGVEEDMYEVCLESMQPFWKLEDRLRVSDVI